jgi:hypothetical protein
MRAVTPANSQPTGEFLNLNPENRMKRVQKSGPWWSALNRPEPYLHFRTTWMEENRKLTVIAGMESATQSGNLMGLSWPGRVRGWG